MESGELGNLRKREFMKTFQLINRKWSFLVIVFIGNHEGIRFNQLKSELTGISAKTLSDTIHTLTQAQIVKSKRFFHPDVKVEYSLTEKGLELKNAIMPTVYWILDQDADCTSGVCD